MRDEMVDFPKFGHILLSTFDIAYNYWIPCNKIHNGRSFLMPAWIYLKEKIEVLPESVW